MMKACGGVDIGKRSSFACRLDLVTRELQFPDQSLTNAGIRDWFTANPVSSICIDGPPMPNQGTLHRRLPPSSHFNRDRRVAEFALKIYGCYGTPAAQPNLDDNNGWMASSMQLYQLLRDSFGWEIDLGSGTGQLLETHPTYAFKSMLGCILDHREGDVQQFLVDPDRRLAPKRPKAAGGHDQRVELLKQLLAEMEFSITETLLNRWSSIDVVDGSLCAVMAFWKAEHSDKVQAVGDPEEGAIYIANLKERLAVKPPTIPLPRPANAGRPRQPHDPGNAVILRLGENGPAGLSQQETIDLAFAAFQEGDSWLPIDTGHQFKLRENLNAVDHQFLLAFGDTLLLRVTSGEVHFGEKKQHAYPGEFNPWPMDECYGWVEMKAVERVEITNFETRQRGTWQPVFSKRGGNLSFGRIPS